jgi:hypothetical protein
MQCLDRLSISYASLTDLLKDQGLNVKPRRPPKPISQNLESNPIKSKTSKVAINNPIFKALKSHLQSINRMEAKH